MSNTSPKYVSFIEEIWPKNDHWSRYLIFSDIAEKARSYGKVELAYHLLKYETSVNRQVPLLVTLDYSDSRSLALQKALDSGDRNLIHNVIWELRSKLPSDQYHMLLRKWSLGKILYQSYCKENQDLEALQEWHQQEVVKQNDLCFILSR